MGNTPYEVIRILFTVVGFLQVITLVCIVTISALKPWGKRVSKQKEANFVKHGPEVAV